MQKREASVDELVGQTLGTCHVEQLLGQNRLSAIYLAQQPEQNRTVAITLFILPEQLSAQTRIRFISRFTSEASTLVLLNHPHILPIYEYGERFGYPYLVTPYVTDGSLANLLKQQKRCTPAYTLQILSQVAAGLDYAHSRGVIHGALKPSHILLRNKHRVQVAGFGLVHMLEMRGIDSSTHPHPELAHLLSIAGTFLGAPEYIAPEFVLGQPPDARSDIYSLGMILFELLSGKLPFSGNNPFEVAMRHVEQPIPALHILYPDVSADLEQVIAQALQRDPAQRFQHAGELANAFAQAVKDAPQTSRALTKATAQEEEVTQRPTTSTLNEETTSTGKWQLVPPIITGRLPAVHASKSDLLPIESTTQPTPGTSTWQLVPPIITGRLPAVQLPSTPPASGLEEDVPLQTVPVDSFEDNNASFSGPSEERSSASAAETSAQAPLASEESAGIYSLDLEPETGRPRRKSSSRKRKYAAMTRRHAVALLATGGIAAVGAIAVGGISLAHLLGNTAHPQTTVVGTSTGPTYGTRPPHATPGHPGTTPTAGKPTPQPTDKPTPNPTHTGTLVGNTSQPVNTADDFNNPTDGKASLLLHLPNNSFVAFEKACTHEGVPVYYDPGTHTLVCPAHFSIFDPTNGGKVIQGPANRPLAGVTIRVNSDGTITTG